MFCIECQNICVYVISINIVLPDAEWTKWEPMLDALRSVSRLILCLTFPVALMTTVRSCRGVKEERSVLGSDHSHLFRAEFQIVNVFVYSFPYIFVLLCLTEHRDRTFTLLTGTYISLRRNITFLV
jgi:hypothetical protein